MKHFAKTFFAPSGFNGSIKLFSDVVDAQGTEKYRDAKSGMF